MPAHLRRHVLDGVLDDVRFTLVHAHSEDEQGVAGVQSSCHGLHDLVPLRQADVRLHDGNDMQFLVVHVLDNRGGESIQRRGQPVARVRSRRTTPDRQFHIDFRLLRVDPPVLGHDAQHVLRHL